MLNGGYVDRMITIVNSLNREVRIKYEVYQYYRVGITPMLVGGGGRGGRGAWS